MWVYATSWTASSIDIEMLRARYEREIIQIEPRGRAFSVGVPHLIELRAISFECLFHVEQSAAAGSGCYTWASWHSGKAVENV